MLITYNKLRGRIIEILGSNNAFMDKMGFSKPTFYAKLSGKSEFTQDEILKACELLNIPQDEIHLYFFAK